MEESTLLRKIEIKENEAHLDVDTIWGIPMWRLFRYQSRLYYIINNANYEVLSANQSVVGKRHPKLISGFWKYVRTKELSVFYTFNRLVYTNNKYVDKFIDPVLECSSLKTSEYTIVDSPNYVGDYPRYHKEHVISNEVRTISKQILKHLMLIIVPIFYRKKIHKFFIKAKTVYELPDSFQKKYYRSLSLFLAEYIYSFFWFKLLHPRRVMVVFREGYFAQIAVCKKLNIPVAEFQHGITLDRTISFTGSYDPRIDPDYFFVFGEYWKGPQFGMPLDRIVNIGWAYSKFLQNTIDLNTEKQQNEVLVISSPEISDAVLEALRVLSEAHGDFGFDIRLHPCETYNDAQMQKLQSIPKAHVVDNKTDSALVLPTYKYVVGENSSVIYEALSVGCKVGMLNLCGLRPAIEMPGIKDNFFVINNTKDFERFLSKESTGSTTKAEFYSEFDNNKFMEFINQKM